MSGPAADLVGVGPVVGLDVGGSKTHLALATGQERIVASASWHRSGLAGVVAGIVQMIRDELDEPPAVVAVGAHGCDTRPQCFQLQAALKATLGVPVLVVNDAELLLPAAGVSSGVAVIAGTGSIAVGYDPDGGLVISGGWGGYLGDGGSATGLFRDAARAVAAACDRREAADPLALAIMDVLDISDLRELPAALATFASPTAWAKHTPAVFDRALQEGSQLAVQVANEGALALTEQIVLLRKLGADARVVVAAGGVIANAAWMQDALRQAIADTFPASELIFLAVPPVTGAVTLALQLQELVHGVPPNRPISPALAAFAGLGQGGVGTTQERHTEKRET